MRRASFSTQFLTMLFAAVSLFMNGCAQSKGKQDFSLHCDTLICLPDQGGKPNLGVAGVFSGISHDRLLVAGGANFPGIPAWKNGIKRYWNTIYVLPFADGKPEKWMDTLFHLPHPVAYGASLTTDNGIICIGGKNSKGYLADVSLLKWDDLKQSIDISTLPPLPIPLASLAAAHIGDTVYVAGGENDKGKQACFYALDLQHLDKGWKGMPSLPGGALSDAVLVSQSDGHGPCIYLIGGRNTVAGGMTTFHDEMYKFTAGEASWKRVRGISGKDGSSAALAAGTGTGIGGHHIALIGGDDGLLFNRLAAWKAKAAAADDPAQKQYWQQRYDSLFTHHPGFNANVYLYNTLTDTWSVPGVLSCPPPATTTIVRYRQQIIIPSGEIRPGIRTSAILRVRVSAGGIK